VLGIATASDDTVVLGCTFSFVFCRGEGSWSSLLYRRIAIPNEANSINVMSGYMSTMMTAQPRGMATYLRYFGCLIGVVMAIAGLLGGACEGGFVVSSWCNFEGGVLLSKGERCAPVKLDARFLFSPFKRTSRSIGCPKGDGGRCIDAERFLGLVSSCLSSSHQVQENESH